MTAEEQHLLLKLLSAAYSHATTALADRTMHATLVAVATMYHLSCADLERTLAALIRQRQGLAL